MREYEGPELFFLCIVHFYRTYKLEETVEIIQWRHPIPFPHIWKNWVHIFIGRTESVGNPGKSCVLPIKICNYSTSLSTPLWKHSNSSFQKNHLPCPNHKINRKERFKHKEKERVELLTSSFFLQWVWSLFSHSYFSAHKLNKYGGPTGLPPGLAKTRKLFFSSPVDDWQLTSQRFTFSFSFCLPFSFNLYEIALLMFMTAFPPSGWPFWTKNLLLPTAPYSFHYMPWKDRELQGESHIEAFSLGPTESLVNFKSQI